MTEFNPQSLTHQDSARLAAYRQNLDFYQGNQWTSQSRHRQLVFNYARVSIDKCTSYLMQGLGFACYPADGIATPSARNDSNQGALSDSSEGDRNGNGGAAGDVTPQSLRGTQRQSNLEPEAATVRRAERLLRQVYQDNNLQQLDWETEVDAAVLGDGCYKVTWDQDHKRIRITAPDISGIFAWWLGDDLSRVWRVASRYTLTRDELQMLYGGRLPGRGPGRQSLSLRGAAGAIPGRRIATSPPAPRRDTTTPARSATITELWTDKAFDLYLDNELIDSRPNPYGFIPFVIFPNLREPKKFWGTSDIPALIQPQRELNRALSQLSRILELSGNPIAVLENIGSAQDIKVQPGAVWSIPEDAKAYLLDLLQGGGIRLHIDYIDLIYRTLHDLSETPRAAYGGIERDLSGAALNIELGSLIQKITRKRTIRTGAYHRRATMILRLAAQYLGDNFDAIGLRVLWGPILPEDISRQAQNEQLLVQAGVHSRRTAMDEMGIMDPDEEFNRWLEERERILLMNQEFRAQSTRGGARERATAAEMEVPE